MRELGLARRMKSQWHDRGETSERQDVDRVVMENRHQTKNLVRAYVFEIEVRNQLARKIALPIDHQDLVLEIHQPAAIESKLPQSARSEQQIQMRKRAERRPLPNHAKARFEQRLIEGPAV